jgi:autotransporter-associated beta strand protein
MKTQKNLFLQLSTFIALGFSSYLQAAALIWTGADGTWQVGDAGQWGANWANGDTATFNGPGGAINLGSAITTGNAALAFTTGNYSISAGAPLSIALGNTTINLGAVTASIGSNVTVNRNTWIIDGTSTATSFFNLTGGTLSAASGNTTIREATVNVGSGSVLRSPGSIICGLGSDGAALNVSGGTVSIDDSGTSLILNNGAATASVTMTISSGAISFLNGSNTAGIRYGGNAGGNTTGVFNLDGGVVTVNKVFESTVGTVNSTFNFNGGTLRARRDNTDFMNGLDSAVVKSGGAIIDTNGRTVTLGQSLSPGSPSGGLTKNGLGTLTLSGISTYTGLTSVTAGRLNVSGSVESDINVASGATLGGEGIAAGTTSFASSGSTFGFDPGTFEAFTASTLNLGSSIVQLSNDTAMTGGETYLVMVNDAGFTGSPLVNFRSPARGTLAYAGPELNFTYSGSASIKWKGGDGSNPTFWDNETTANWDNASTTDKFFPLDTVLFDDTASSFNVAIPAGSVKPASVTFDNSATYTLAGGAIQGTTGLTKNGSGIVTLGNANTFSGSTNVNAGALQLSGGSAITDAGLISLADSPGATLRVIGSETIGALSGGGPSGGNVSIDAAQTLTLSSGTQTHVGAVGGAGSLDVSGAVQTLNGVVSNTGGLSVNAGRLTLAGNNTFTGATSVAANSGIIISNANALGATGTGNETTILGSGGLASGQIGLSGGITFAAEKIIGSGVGHVSPATVNGFLVQQRGMIQSVSGNNTFSGDIEINSNGSTRFGTQDGAQLTLSGNITRSVGLTDVRVLFRAGNTGGDFITLTGTNNDFDECSLFSASTTTNTGVRLGVDNTLPVHVLLGAANSSAVLTTLDLDGNDQTIGGIKADMDNGGQFKIINRDTLDPSTLTLANTRNTSSSLAAISNDGGAGGVIHIVKTGGFEQALGATNTYTGTTSIQGGRLSFLKQVSLYNNTPASWTPAMISVDSGATLGLTVGGTGEFTATDVGTIITSLSASNGNGFKAGSSLFLDVTADTVVATPLTDSTGTSGGAIGLRKSGTGKLTLAGANSYSGDTTVSLGTLKLDAANAANNSSTVTIASTGATLELNFAGTDTVDKLFIDGVQQPADVYEAVGNPGEDTEIAQLTGSGTLTVLSGPPGFAAWQGANGTTGALDADHDNDGVDNGTEYFLFGSTNSTGFTSLPGVANDGGTLSVTWTKASTGYTGSYGSGFVVETSNSLATDSWVTAAEGSGPDQVEVSGNDVTYIFPNGMKTFARLKVTGP